MTIVKICGITDVANGLAAIDAGAEYLGFVFYPPSSRWLDVDVAARLVGELRAARPNGWRAVGVFVNEPSERIDAARATCGLDVVQLNGDESPEYVRGLAGPTFKAVRFGRAPAPAEVPSAAFYGADRILLDANVPGRYGGTGMTYEWAAVRAAVADGFLAGGLTPENVAGAIAAARPWGVDVSSGVEREGTKDPELIRRFIAAAREAGP